MVKKEMFFEIKITKVSSIKKNGLPIGYPFSILMMILLTPIVNIFIVCKNIILLTIRVNLKENSISFE